MTKHYISLFLLCFSSFSFSQEANTAAGGDAEGKGGTVSYSVGQLAYRSLTDPDGSVDLGVQIPIEVLEEDSSSLALKKIKMLDLKMSSFPNPTTARVELKIDAERFDNMTYVLFDLKGARLSSGEIKQMNTQVSLENLVTASYVLVVYQGDLKLKSFKIQKQ
jgi:hypothetical protein